MKPLVALIASVAVFATLAQAETIQVLRNQRDVPLLSESVVDCSSPTNGHASVRNGTLFYTPSADYTGEDTLQVTLADQQTRTVKIDVRAYPNFVFIRMFRHSAEYSS